MRAAPRATDALVRGGTGQAVQRGARFEAHGHAGAAREVDDLLQARTAGALRDHDALEGVAGAQGFGDGMDAAEQGHGQASGWMSSPLLKRLVKFAMATTRVISTICSCVKCWNISSRDVAAWAVRVSSRA